ncbi:ferredoxin-type protein NapF [Marilutibacter chinensis]|uniref:Ferredoxin-type protein NapF n=1 Tax=Marilutibacter chinensis TaxID=2912247 RepID=A0ABS9HXU6_9GAMM|nr:ferredoxin-type protein NapF [Lysobacter chinensis]
MSVPVAARRAFLLGRARAVPVHRPPWALAEAGFLDACTACGACIDACPEAVLARGGGGYPVFDPGRGECTFCGDCATHCGTGALHRVAGMPPWNWSATVGDACLSRGGVACQVCQDACPEQAIALPPVSGGRREPRIDTARCSGCGACVPVCPADAVVLVQADDGRHRD